MTVWRNAKATRELKQLGPEERLRRAKARTDKLVDHVRSLFLLHESNAIVIYSATLREQIPRSHAGHAFSQFQGSMHLFELLRLTALWDSYGTDRESIPTVIDLVDDPEVQALVVERTRQSFATMGVHDLTPSDDPLLEEIKREWFDGYRQEMAIEEAIRTERQLRFALRKTRGMANSKRLRGLIAFRNHRLAHNLELENEDLIALSEGRGLRYGDERYVLDQTKMVVDALHMALNGSSFMWDDAREQSRRQAKALWEACRFAVVD